MYAAVGAPGSAHDARVFRSINLYQHICNGEILPTKNILLGSESIPFCFIADSAFPVHGLLVKPYPSSSTAGSDERTFNGLLSSAHITTEHCFGMPKGCFRLFCRCTELKPEAYTIWIQSGIAMHNICQENDDKGLNHWRVRVERLHMIHRVATAMNEDKRGSEDTRNRIKRWIMSV